MKRTALLLLFTGMITAAELPSPYDADGRIAIIERCLSERRGLRLFVIDNFEGERTYHTRAASTQLADIQFIKRSPDSAPYRRELDLIASRAQPFEHEKSLFLHFSFEDPGKQVFQVLPDHPVQIPGIPQRISLWVNGQSTHALVLLFQNSDGREVRVNAGRLDHAGWTRVEMTAPDLLRSRGRRLERRYTTQFLGFVIESSPREEAGDASVMIDNLLVLTDLSELMIQGEEIPDTWGRTKR
jgi:hypothetical protein